GAILVDASRKVLIEAENGYMPSHDGTAHAERLLATQACTTIDADILRNATLYSSAEPCAMCAGAIYWAGVGRLVYGLSEHRLRGTSRRHRLSPGGTARRLELYRDAPIDGRLGAGVGALTIGSERADAGHRIVVEAELVLPVAIGDPEIDEVRILRAHESLAGV